MKTTVSYLLLACVALSAPTAQADSFGSGANLFEIEFVPIGDPDNPNDTTGTPNPAGKVEYDFRMGKFEISEGMINKANALGGLGITHTNRGAVNKPATNISWFEAATFVNWLNTSTGHTPAYKFIGSAFEPWQSGDEGYNAANPFRNSEAYYFLPSSDEWYKAAYYDPDAGVYYNYPTGSNTRPDGIDFFLDPTFDALFPDSGVSDTNDAPNDIFDVGVLSPYGTAGQGGNVAEWVETEWIRNGTPGRPVRGGQYRTGNYTSLRSSNRGWSTPTNASALWGFRVASRAVVPEPSTMLLASLAMGSILMGRKR